jgi:putative endonuclease
MASPEPLEGASMSLKTWFAARVRPLSFGELGERQAARHLRCLGYHIVASRRRSRYGEIDVIAVDGKTVVFVEVKTRRTDVGITPAESIDLTRRRRMTRAAIAFLKAHSLLDHPARFDIVEVVWPQAARRPEIRHHPNAFPAEGRGQFFR